MQKCPHKLMRGHLMNKRKSYATCLFSLKMVVCKTHITYDILIYVIDFFLSYDCILVLFVIVVILQLMKNGWIPRNPIPWKQTGIPRKMASPWSLAGVRWWRRAWRPDRRRSWRQASSQSNPDRSLCSQLLSCVRIRWLGGNWGETRERAWNEHLSMRNLLWSERWKRLKTRRDP